MKISVCGKGGSGKSTLVAMLAKQARQRGLEVLVIDADDSNAGLSRMLGFDHPPVPLMALVGGKDRIKAKMGSGSLLSQSHIRIKDIPPEYIIESNGLMQVSIGKILQALEGCACPMGVLCREFLKKLLLDNHEIAIVDMEAGVEHFGRGVVEAIDQIVVVVEPSFDSLKMAEKINSLASGMHKKLAVVVNKTVSEAVSLKMMRELSADGIKIIGYVPIDPLVSESCWEGHIPQMGAAFEAAGKVLDTLLQSDEGIRKSG